MNLTDIMPRPAPEKPLARCHGGTGPLGPTGAQENARTQITHDQIIDYILANPRSTYAEIAANFRYSRGGIAVICNSDSFKARYEKRKADIVDPLVVQRIEDRLNGLAVQSMEILSRKLENSDDGGFALKVMEATTRANGYGVAKPAAINTQFVVHLPGPAASAAEWASKFSSPDAQLVRVETENLQSEASE